jgi:hypothetical protein
VLDQDWSSPFCESVSRNEAKLTPRRRPNLRAGVSLDYRRRSGSLGQEERERDDVRLSLLQSYAL